MNHSSRIAGVIGALTLLLGITAASAAEQSYDGLEKVQAAGLDLVYARPGATLAGYTQVWLRPITVAFRRDWTTQPRPGSRIAIGDQQALRERLAAAMREAAVRELQNGGYVLVEAAGEDVLEVSVSIVDLYLNAPDVPTAGRVEFYTISTGEMTLQAELRDSASGELIARVIDRRVDPDQFPARITTSVDNIGAAQDAARIWASALRTRLDAARRIGS